MKNPFIILTFFILVSCSKVSQNEQKDSMNQPDVSWKISEEISITKNQGLQNIESIIYDSIHQVFYTSNGNKYQAGSEGFISKLDINGNILALNWLSGLNRPTGMALNGTTLYVADVNVLLEIHTDSAKIMNQIPEPTPNSGLNDVAVNSQGEIFISASFIHAVLKLDSNRLSIWAQDKDKLQWANGILAEDEQIVVAGLLLNKINYQSKHIEQVDLPPSVSDFDGLIADQYGGYFLTTVENSRFLYLDRNTQIHQLAKGEDYFGDLVYLPQKNQVYIPRGSQEKSRFFISRFTLKK